MIKLKEKIKKRNTNFDGMSNDEIYYEMLKQEEKPHTDIYEFFVSDFKNLNEKNNDNRNKN
jgi:hypothetical protein